MNIEDTIDAFVDGVTVDPQALDAALASPDGRAYLIDALALRRLMEDEPQVAAETPRKRSWSPLSLARAAVFAIALVGLGYAAGVRTEGPDEDAIPTNSVQSIAAPEPTRVIELKPGVTWHESKGGD
ncbi:MAG: hypothetical protein M3R55_11070 [Acidobacteriota bacterium]|nr:hypothetical protein [Acidobacteriota bacterium]